MKKVVFYWLMLLPILGFSDLDVNKVTKVLLSIEQNKPLKYFNENVSLTSKFQKNSKGLHFSSLAEADILFMSKIKKSSKLVITDSYEKLQKSDKSVIGAVYIKKERTHIFLVRERLKKSGLRVPSKMKKYLISECNLNLLCLLSSRT
jgi:hypothetical protein